MLLDQPVKGVLASLIIILISLLVHLNFMEIYLTVLSLVFLVGSLSKFFFPVTYSFYDDYFEIRGLILPHRRPWSEFKRIVKFQDGVLLSPFLQPTRLDNYRSMFVRYKNNQDSVLEFLSTRINSAVK